MRLLAFLTLFNLSLGHSMANSERVHKSEVSKNKNGQLMSFKDLKLKRHNVKVDDFKNSHFQSSSDDYIHVNEHIKMRDIRNNYDYIDILTLDN